MNNIENLAVQLEEAKRLIELGTIPHLRLAFILLDNAVELTMHRMADRELELSHISESIAEGYKRLLQDFGEKRRLNTNAVDEYARIDKDMPEIRTIMQENESRIIPKNVRKQISRLFGSKVDFLVQRDIIDVTLGLVAKKLHKYRNEVYHRDSIRRATIRPATLLYFHVSCTLFALYRPSTISGGGRLDEEGYPGLARFQEHQDSSKGLGDPFALPERIGRQLQSELGLDTPALRDALIDHLSSRLDELDDSIEVLCEWLRETHRKEDVVRLVQLKDPDPFLPTEVLQTMTFRYDVTDLEKWRSEVARLRSESNLFEMFAGFARIEDNFEPFGDLVNELAAELERAIQLEIDVARGK